MRKTLFFISVMVLVAAGCTTRLTDFTAISTKNIDWSKAETYQRATTRTTGKDTTYIIIIIPTGSPNMKEAIDRAIESVPGAVALVDGVLYHNSWYIPYIYGESSYVVEGTALIDPELVGSVMDSQYLVTYMDKNGNVKRMQKVSKSEYEVMKAEIVSGD